MTIVKRNKRKIKKYIPYWEKEGMTWAESVLKKMHIKFMSPQAQRSLSNQAFSKKAGRLALRYGKKKK